MSRLGVVGAGTMGAGIAQLGTQAGWDTLLYDPVADVDAVIAMICGRLTRKGVTHEPPRHAIDLAALADCDVIIEAIPEQLDLKRALVAQLSEIATRAVLASNTSSIPITEIASAAADPARVVGMHFFNPPPVMRLVEVVSAAQSSQHARDVIRDLAGAMGKRVVDAADVVGFVVNRTNRPFGLEALRCLQAGVAGVEAIDAIVRLGGGFRMGPFEVQDLVGIDVGFEVSLSFYNQSFGEPRWRPSPLSARMVSAGWLGRKSGRGWYSYPTDGIHRAEDPVAPTATTGATIVGEGAVADALRAVAGGKGGPTIVVDGLGGHIDGEPFYAIAPLTLVEITGDAGEHAFRHLGLHTVRVRASPGGVLPRIISQLVNEAYFSLGDQIASAADIDDGLVLGLNHPRGPIAWGELMGLQPVLNTLIELRDAFGDAYVPAPTLAAAIHAQP